MSSDGERLAVLIVRFLLPEIYPVLKTKIRGRKCEGGRWIELAQDDARRRALMLVALTLLILLP
jgi:hypothetical protein